MIPSRKSDIRLTNSDYKLLSEYKIYEEKGVNFENVIPEYQRVRDIIMYEFVRNKYYDDKTINAKRKTFEIDDTLFGDPFTFNVNAYSFTSYNYDIEKSKYNSYKKTTIDKEKNILYVTLTIIEGQLLVGELMNSLGHEIQHYFETELSGSEYNKKPLYKTSIDIVNRTYNNENEKFFKQCIGYGLYLSFIEEREGFANGLYARIMEERDNLNYNNIDELCRHDESYTLLKLLQYINDRIEKNDFNQQEQVWINDILEITGKEWKTIVNKLKYTYKDFERRINNIKRLLIKKLKLSEDICMIPYSEGYIEHILERLNQEKVK